MRGNDTGLSRQRVPVPHEFAAHDFGLSADEAHHTAGAHGFIAGEIAAAGGWISFERYMDLALYAPGMGYYSAGARKLGGGGDFTTAPELSQLFGNCVARQCAVVLNGFAAGSILEIGAGSGRLAVDVLARLAALGQLPARYAILEISADLRERQRTLVQEELPPPLRERVVWLDAPPAEPFEGVILANEVLDALPVTRFRWSSTRCEELGVALADGTLVAAARPASAALTERCNILARAGGGWDEGYVSEYCRQLADWTRSVTRSLRAGTVLWFDYGLPRAQYYFPQRRDGTLLSHFRHRVHDDPLLRPGLQDITAWVDFTALAEAGRAAGFEVAGFTTQAHFLAGAGIDGEMQAIAGGDPQRHARLAIQARQLMLPGEMGERFKAMAWTRAAGRELPGFALLDLRHTL